MSKALQLSLKRKWFEMTAAGIKTEDYREITGYWRTRLLNPLPKNTAIGFFTNEAILELMVKRHKGFKVFDTNIMTLGYPKSTDTDRILKFEHAGIEIRTGNPEWGAEPGELYFVIKHGKRLQ
jgi:hypothetical protein